MRDGIISLSFFLIEFGILLWVLRNYRNHLLWKEIAVLLGLLQAYQLSEFLICIGMDPTITGRVAFTVITFLPPLGHFIANKLISRSQWDTILSGTAALYFAGFYLFQPGSVQLVDCNPLFAVYSHALSWAYGYYYFAVILYSVLLLTAFLVRNRDTARDETAVWLYLGYLGFLLPMGLTVLVNPELYYAIPSIMCKYAIVLALSVAFMMQQTAFDI
ncbi:MAG: hypothetical protein ACXAE3_07850 [Candidatus Kariarchaeaceae archaeon]|jgi:hypothetical protein